MIVVHALIIFSEKIGFDHLITCIRFFYTKKKNSLIFYAHGEFCRFSLDWFPSLIKLHFRYAYNVW